MKTIKLIITTLFLTASSFVCAQIEGDGDAYYQPELNNSYQPTTRYTSYHHSYYESDYEEGWGSFYGGYAPMQLTTTAKNGESRLFHTATVGFCYNFQIGYSPVYIEPRFEVSGSWFSERYSNGDKYSFNLYYGKIPINIAFRLDAAPGFAIVPFAGVFVKWNAYAEEIDRNKYGDYEKWVIFDDGYTYDYDYNRFQFGYQAGLKLIIGNSFSLSAAWTADLTPFSKYFINNLEEKEKFQGVAFTLGFDF